jgi:hypothetical protein
VNSLGGFLQMLLATAAHCRRSCADMKEINMKYITILSLIIISMVIFTVAPSARAAGFSSGHCELRDVIARMKFESIERAAAIAEQVLPIIKQLEELTNKAKKPDIPIKDQLSSDDIIKFTELSERIKTTNLAQLMESRRERDLTVIEKMTMIADRANRWNDHPAEDDPDFIVYSALQLLRVAVKKNNITVPSTQSCTLDYALHLIENEGIEKLNAIKGLDSVVSSIKAILAKYGMDKIDRSRLSKADLEKINELETNILNPAERLRSFITDIENIKLMSKASEIMYEANKQDIALGGGDIDAIGKTIQRKSKNKEYDDDLILAIGFWTMINEKMPSQIVQEWGEADKTQPAIKKDE